jgi:primosomal protein N' (replication factor Y) (superfamily II helicase)
MTTLFADVIVPLSVPNFYTYRIPLDLNDYVKAGQRVVVQFGKNKLYTAIIRKVHETPPKAYQAKYIEHLLDAEPVVNEKQLKLWEWISSYYMCNIGDVMAAALPGAMKVSSETRILLNPGFDKEDWKILTDKEFLIAEALEMQNLLSVQDLCNILDQKNVYPVIKGMIDKRAIVVEEEVKEKFKPKIESFVKLNPFYQQNENLKECFEQLEKKAPKQLDVLMSYINISKALSAKPQEVKRTELIKTLEGGESSLSTLVKKGILEIYEQETGRLGSFFSSSETKDNRLNEDQQRALDEVKGHFAEKDVVLLHGITSSGKTEVYIKLIKDAVSQGKQVLYLLPEIALTTQIVTRLKKYFGNKVGVYHSKYNEQERVEIWRNLVSPFEDKTATGERFSIILGARSSLFLPYENLGLIIVDEEHETTFKQQEPAPRYNARDASVILASLHGAKVLLGSATPSVESYFNASSGKYGLVEMKERFGGVQMPEILISDVKEATHRKIMKSHFSPMMLDGIKLALENKEQVILFQNRRGFAPFLQCNKCSWTPSCTNCDVSLTYHKAGNSLRCHYCGYNMKTIRTCSACGSHEIFTKGFGTEKIEDDLSIFLPDAKIARLDLDSTRAKNAYKQIISDFEDRKIDILVGTQMVTKGLDFDNVGLVGILNADSMLRFPDFRSSERSFHLMVQVSGRAGRKNKRGKVIIQTFDPGHPVIHQIIRNDYHGLFLNEISERKRFFYPPFYRLIELTLKHKDNDLLSEGAKHLAGLLRENFGKRILGPEAPLVARVRNLYLKKIMIKIEREASAPKVKETLQQLIIDFNQNKDFKTIRVIVDVDPI